MSNPRVRVITHMEIFPDPSHLPTFSSAAIECHLHKIPGLSKRFLYINDDVVFGKPVFRENFMTEENGFKVYLTWPVPDCSIGCPSNWLSDGFCDKPCNTSECSWDGGDCLHVTSSSTIATQQVAEENCSPGCSDTWLGDKFCDSACNTPECAFDLADCGVNSFFETFDQIERTKILLFNSSTTILTLNESLSSWTSSVLYLNLSSFLESYNVKKGFYEKNPFLRSIGVNVKFGVLTLLFQGNFSETEVEMQLEWEEKGKTYKQLISLLVDRKDKGNLERTKEAEGTKSNTSTPLHDMKSQNFSFPIQNYDDDKQQERETWNTYIEDPQRQRIDTTYSRIDRTDSISKIEFPTASQSSRSSSQLLSLTSHHHLGPHTLPDTYLHSSRDKDYEGENDKVVIEIQRILASTEDSSSQLSSDNVATHRLTTASKGQTDNGKFSPGKTETQFSMVSTYRPFRWERVPLSYFPPEMINVHSRPSRHLMDAYGDSLRHVNRLYNRAFGPKARRVPAHMSHLIDVDIMTRLQRKFAHEFLETSRSKIRRSTDMQFAFSYFYFLMSESRRPNVSYVLQEVDVDHSG